MSSDVPAHAQGVTHRYLMHFPEHPARKDDPHYVDFEEYHRRHRATARCYVGERIGYDECRDAQGRPAPAPEQGEQPGLELHHSVVEFSLQNGVDFGALEHDYPGISNKTDIGEWIERAEANLRWLCAWHHRGAAGAHTASHSDWTAGCYVPGLIGPAT